MSNIYIALNGGLGNQLYIAATGICLSEILNQEIYFDTHAYKKYKLHKLLVHKLLPNIKYENRNIIFRGYPLLSRQKRVLKLIKETSPSYDEKILNNLKNRFFHNDYFLKGYFQSLSYFSLIIPKLKIEIDKNLRNLNEELSCKKITDILNKTLTIHIRRKDKLSEVNKSIYGFINKEGFKKIIYSISDKYDFQYLLILGDDQSFNIEFKKFLLSDTKIKYKIITSEFLSNKISPFNDFFYMINSKGLILNNSSFSLWSGYLSNSKNIFYPSLLFPIPKHQSIKDLNSEDLIMPHWVSYKNQYL